MATTDQKETINEQIEYLTEKLAQMDNFQKYLKARPNIPEDVKEPFWGQRMYVAGMLDAYKQMLND